MFNANQTRLVFVFRIVGEGGRSEGGALKRGASERVRGLIKPLCGPVPRRKEKLCLENLVF